MPPASRIAVHAATLLTANICACLVAFGILFTAPLTWANTYTYEIEVMIRYDVNEGGVVLPDTEVWGMPWPGELSGTIDLAIDGAGNVTGSTPTDPGTGQGLLYGEFAYSADRNTWCQITNGSWGTPVGRIAPLTGGTVDLTGTVLGDFYGLTITSGFLEDGNSGDYFYMGNGLGLDGKLEFTATRSDGVTLDVKAKQQWGGGSGTYLFGIDTGTISYSNGTDLFSLDLMGVTAFYLEVDVPTQTFWTASPQVLLEDAYFLWWYPGRRIDSFTGSVDPSGNFTGAAHFQGYHFASLDFISGSGMFEDGNSTGFDLSNGLVLGDQFSTVLTDVSGLFDLVIDGTLISQSTVTGVTSDVLPQSFAVLRNVPNPFNPQTRIDFSLSEASHASLTVYDVAGRTIAELVNERLQPRIHSYVWDGHDLTGAPVSSGIYLYRLTIDGRSMSRRMLLVK